MAILEIDLDAKQAAFEKEVDEVEAWWKIPQHAGLKRAPTFPDVLFSRASEMYRPYSARRVVMPQYSQRREYASSTQAMKL